MRLDVKRRQTQEGEFPFLFFRVQIEDFWVTAEDVVAELSFSSSPRFCWGWS